MFLGTIGMLCFFALFCPIADCLVARQTGAGTMWASRSISGFAEVKAAEQLAFGGGAELRIFS